MSDLCIYEFEDNVWDEFCETDDHIVPDPSSKRADDDPAQDDSLKKSRHEVNSISNNSGVRSAGGCFDQQRERKGFSSLSKRNIIPENDSWCQSPSGIFPPSSGINSMKEPSSLASDNTMAPSHDLKSNNADSKSGDKCANDTILGCKTTSVDNDSFSYPLADMSHTNNNLDIFENIEDKESNDLLYYGWPDIGNFEDVDMMFRSCDSDFGLGASNEDELGWLPSEDNTGGCGDVMKSDFTFPCPESNAVENINESAMTSPHVRSKDSSWISENSDSYLSFANGPAIADSKDGLITKEQGKRLSGKIQPRMSTDDLSKTGNSGMINDHEKQLKPKNQSMGKRKEHYSGNVSFGYMSNLTNETTLFRPGGISHQAYPFVHMPQQAFGADSYSYLQNPLSYVHSDSSHFSNQNSANPRPSAVKSETNEPKKKERLHNHQGLNTCLQNASTPVHASICNPGSEGHFSVDKVETRSDTEGVLLPIPAGLGSSNVQERSMMTSGLDDTSPEAASFHQLQLVMEQLDWRTKLCIRDSLYRLARSAEQRHNHANLNGDERDASGAFLAGGTNGFMDMETDTNPIDRSIAHLLFHRPSESPAIPSDVRGLVKSQPVTGENLVICDETASELDKDLNR